MNVCVNVGWSLRYAHAGQVLKLVPPRSLTTWPLVVAFCHCFLQLRAILEVYACYRPDVGYVQGMSYFAAMFCLHIDDPTLVFQCLANLMVKQHVFAFYKHPMNTLEQCVPQWVGYCMPRRLTSLVVFCVYVLWYRAGITPCSTCYSLTPIQKCTNTCGSTMFHTTCICFVGSKRCS